MFEITFGLRKPPAPAPRIEMEDDAIAKAKGAGGRKIVRAQLSELRDSVWKAILSRIKRNNGLTALDLFDISEELAHNTPNNAEGTASLLSKVMQSQQDGISSYLKDAIPGLARDIENYNGLKR